MTAARPTEGPWICFVSRCAEGCTRYHVFMHTHTAIALNRHSFWEKGYKPPMDEDGYYQPDEYADIPRHHVANARLIAAAPELLSVLRGLEWGGAAVWCARCCEHQGACPDCGCLSCEGHAEGCDIGSAIAKAEGREVTP